MTGLSLSSPPAANVLSVSRAANQSVSDSTYTAVLYDTTALDTQSAYASGNGRYTPTVAGKYLVIATGVYGVVTAISNGRTAIYKNGAAVAESIGNAFTANVASSTAITCSTIVSMNGTTDYIQTFCYVAGTGGGNKVTGDSTGNILSVVYLGR